MGEGEERREEDPQRVARWLVGKPGLDLDRQARWIDGQEAV